MSVIKTLLVLTAVQLTAKSGPELVEIHNTLAKEVDGNLVTRFADKAAAVKRVQKVIEAVKALPKYKVTDISSAKKTPSLADHANNAVVTPATKKAKAPAGDRTKDPRKMMKGDRPKADSADGKVLNKLEAATHPVKIADVAKALGRTDRQVRNSLSYLRRKYGFDISMLNGNSEAALKSKVPAQTASK